MLSGDSYLLLGKRRQMVRDLKLKGISDSSLLSAFEKVERHRFIDHFFTGSMHAFVDTVYYDSSIPIGEGRFLPPPSHTAKLLESCQIKPGNTVLEIGAGTGYQAALLSELEAEIYTIETNKSMCLKLKSLFPLLGYLTINLIDEDNYKDQVYDKIIINEQEYADIDAFLKKLKTGGILAISIIENKSFKIKLYIKINEDDVEMKEI